MKDISNKTLVLLLLAAITISLGGTFMSLNRLNTITKSAITGFATANESGVTTLTVLGYNSISLIGPTTLAMGSCTPTGGNGSWVNTSVDTTVCSAANENLLNFTIENDGNQAVNVTVRSNVTNAQFFGGGTDPKFRFIVQNTSSRTGCFRNFYDNQTENGVYTEFANATPTEYWGCANLTFPNTADQMVTEFLWFIPSDAPPIGARAALISFQAATIS